MKKANVQKLKTLIESMNLTEGSDGIDFNDLSRLLKLVTVFKQNGDEFIKSQPNKADLNSLIQDIETIGDIVDKIKKDLSTTNL